MVSFFYRIVRLIFMTFLLGMVAAFLLLTGGCGYMYYRYGHDLPDHDVVKEYEPKIITRLHAADGSRSAFQCSTARRVCSSVPLYLRISVPAKFEASSQSQYWMSAITPKRKSGSCSLALLLLA